jgi:putative spermidine/putrescine transport system ATP-binding protein
MANYCYSFYDGIWQSAVPSNLMDLLWERSERSFCLSKDASRIKNLRQSVQLQLKKLHQELGITIVYVTHDQEEALHLSDRIVIMDKGKIIQNGTPRELYFSPANAFVAGFLGECNFVTSTTGLPIAVRPENLHLSPQNSDTHSVDAEIENVIFLGTNSKIAARQNGAQILAIADNSVDHRNLQPRQPIRFHVADKDILRL